MKVAPSSRLDSWKAIADYLNRNVRTVTRWADERGMPIHHVPGGKRGAVFAFTAEIDGWLVHQNGGGLGAEGSDADARNSVATGALPTTARSIFTRWRSVSSLITGWRVALLILAAILVSAAISAVLHPMHSQDLQLASVNYGADTIEGKAADGQTMWVHRYPQGFSTNYFGTSAGMSQGFRISDFLGDGRKEVAAVVPLRSGPNPNDLDVTKIDFFTSAGNLIWSYFPDRTFRFGEHDLKGPWAMQDLLVTEDVHRQTIWVAASHHTWGNSFVAQLDPRTGRDALRFVNTGNLRRLSELKTVHGNYLLAGGFNNEWDSGSLAIVNEEKVFAASPQTPGTRHECNSCPPGAPDYYFVFPRSEINRVTRAYEDSVTEVRVSEDGIEISKSETGITGKELTLYLLLREPPFSVISLRYNSDYDRVHRAWSAEGKLTHSLESCPERMHPQPVRLWTPSNGWTEIPVRPAKANQ